MEDILDPEMVNLKSSPLIHFCCFNGSDSSPPFRVFPTLDNFMFDIKGASKAYLEKTVQFRHDHDEVFVYFFLLITNHHRFGYQECLKNIQSLVKRKKFLIC